MSNITIARSPLLQANQANQARSFNKGSRAPLTFYLSDKRWFSVALAGLPKGLDETSFGVPKLLPRTGSPVISPDDELWDSSLRSRPTGPTPAIHAISSSPEERQETRL